VKRLYRDTRDKLVCGVCSGLAEYAGVDPVIVRLATVFLLLIAPFQTIILYLAGCILIPEKPSSGAGEETVGQPSSRGDSARPVATLVAVIGVILIITGLLKILHEPLLSTISQITRIRIIGIPLTDLAVGLLLIVVGAILALAGLAKTRQ